MPHRPMASLLAALSLPLCAHAQQNPSPDPAPNNEATTQLAAASDAANAQLATNAANLTPTQPSPLPADDTAVLRSEQERLNLENNLINDRVNRELASMRTEIQRMRMEREALNERMALDDAKRRAETYNDLAEARKQSADLMRDSEIAKARAEKLSAELKAIEAASGIQISKLQTEIAQLEAEAKRSQYADAKPVYLDNPLRPDGTLVISDRRIPLNGPITPATADFVTDRISYFNNKDSNKPIFLVIDDSPGGSVMAGYRILKSMQGSRAPVHVVVKSFAASMAATLATLAETSYAYPNAVILHHQISSTLVMARLNLTQQKEFLQESTRWWTRLAEPIAAKMGISSEEFIKRMYERSSSGDWSEFADEAVKLKWIDHLVTAIEETSLVKSPDLNPANNQDRATAISGATLAADEEGHPVMYLPRLNPKDVYFMYNPDQFYRLR